MSLFTVTITGDATAFEVYAGLAAVTHYLNGRNVAGAVTFRGLTADDQARALINATAFIDQQAWQGTATVPAVGGTTLQWPRTGVVDGNGVAVDSSTIPNNILSAVAELTALFADDPDFESVLAATNVRSISAGSARVENFGRPIELGPDGEAPPFPARIMKMVFQYMNTAVSAGKASGTDGVSIFDVDDGDGNDIDPWGRTFPL